MRSTGDPCRDRGATPGAEPRGFAAIALGKQGSRELNYSSDIDPILLFDPATSCRDRARDDPSKRRRCGSPGVSVELLQARDGDGYVLRVDLRLRPSPEATPIALPVDAAVSAITKVRRAAMGARRVHPRARVAAGDRALGSRFLDAIRPFVWRRALDLRRDRRDPRPDRPPHPRPLCAGGPRIRPRLRPEARARRHSRGRVLRPGPPARSTAGATPALRAPATRDALAALGRRRAGSSADEAAALHADPIPCSARSSIALQMVDDRQTHTPAGAGRRAGRRVARLHGLGASARDLLDLLSPHRSRPSGRIYDRARRRGWPRGCRSRAAAAGRLARLTARGFAADGEGASRAARAHRRAGAAGRLSRVSAVPAARAALEDGAARDWSPALAGPLPDPACGTAAARRRCSSAPAQRHQHPVPPAGGAAGAGAGLLAHDPLPCCRRSPTPWRRRPDAARLR